MVIDLDWRQAEVLNNVKTSNLNLTRDELDTLTGHLVYSPYDIKNLLVVMTSPHIFMPVNNFHKIKISYRSELLRNNLEQFSSSSTR